MVRKFLNPRSGNLNSLFRTILKAFLYFLTIFLSHYKKALECIAYLNVICGQSWEHIEAIIDLRSAKIIPHWAPFPNPYIHKRVIQTETSNPENKGLIWVEISPKAAARESNFNPTHFLSRSKLPKLLQYLWLLSDYVSSVVFDHL